MDSNQHSNLGAVAVDGEKKRSTSVGQMLFGHAVLLIFCVGLPGLFTAVAPLSVIHLSRENGVVNAEVSKRLLFIVPFSRAAVREVQSVGDRFVAGTSERKPGSGTGSRTQTEDSAYLRIESAIGSIQAEVSPVNIEGVKQKVGAFLDDASQTSLRMVVVANWKFGVFAGGLLSLLTVLYVYLQFSSLVRWVLSVVNGTRRKSP